MTLAELKKGDRAVITKLTGPHSAALAEQGFLQGAPLELLPPAPLGDPIRVRLWGGVLAIRKEDAAGIKVKKEER